MGAPHPGGDRARHQRRVVDMITYGDLVAEFTGRRGAELEG